MSDSLLSQLKQLRILYAEAETADPKVAADFTWTIVKMLLQHCDEIDSITARRLLADCIKLSVVRPSKLHSALLAAAVKVANTCPEFRFAAFLHMWDIKNLRPEDRERQKTKDGKTFYSLAERTAKALAHTLLLHPEDRSLLEPKEAADPTTAAVSMRLLLTDQGYAFRQMIVTRIKEATGKDGHKYRFVTLCSPEGIELEAISHTLTPSPLRPLPEGKRHYVNIGQLYDCLLRPTTTATLSLSEAYLSAQQPAEAFPTAIGYIESIDTGHGHMHVYDAESRHFVAPILRFSREQVGDFVKFIPIVPQTSKFKTAILLSTIPATSAEVQTILRDIRITGVNRDRGFASWELIDKSRPITESLSPLQLSQGEQSPSFTNGFISLKGDLALSSNTYKAFIYLKRGKDKQKRPHVARLF